MKRSPLFLGACLLFVLSAIAGSFLDDKPARPSEIRAGYRVLQADFHAHTRFSDGFLSPMDLVDQAARRGLDVIGVSEHNQVFPAKIARAYSNLISGPTVVVSEEVTTHDYHLLAIGIEDRIDARKSLRDVIDDVHRQGGIIAAAHPTHRFSKPLFAVLNDLDATEVMHPIAYQGNASGIGHWSEMRDFYEDAPQRTTREGHILAALGDSDYHFGSILGITRTFVFAKGDTAPDVVDAIKHDRAVTFDLEGHGYGDPALVAALVAEPLTPRPTDYAYRGEGPLDLITRTLGFFGVLGLLFFRRAPR
jgi:hypothetical protein